MPVKKILDANLLIYSLLEGHPASKKCEEFIEQSLQNVAWVTTPVTFFETYFILKKVYGCDEKDAVEKIEALLKLPIETPPIAREDVLPTLRTCSKFKLHVNDGLLYSLALNTGISSIATDDVSLGKVCSDSGMTVETPITPADRKEMLAWERNNLPDKGMSRILLRIYSWLKSENEEIANRFERKTNFFKRLP